jgi:hypothetical protein
MRRYAAAAATAAGVVALATALYMSVQDPLLGSPWGASWASVKQSQLLLTALSAVGILFGMGLLMLVAAAVTLRHPAIGGILIVVPAVVGLVYTYTHQWTRVELLSYWAAPLLLCWLGGILAGYALQRETEAYG